MTKWGVRWSSPFREGTAGEKGAMVMGPCSNWKGSTMGSIRKNISVWKYLTLGQPRKDRGISTLAGFPDQTGQSPAGHWVLAQLWSSSWSSPKMPSSLLQRVCLAWPGKRLSQLASSRYTCTPAGPGVQRSAARQSLQNPASSSYRESEAEFLTHTDFWAWPALRWADTNYSSTGQGEPPNKATLLPLLLPSYKMHWNPGTSWRTTTHRRDQTRLRATKNIHSVDRLFFSSLIKYLSTFTYASIRKIIVPNCKQVNLRYSISLDQEWNKRRLPSHS